MLCGVESGQGQGGVSLINNHDDATGRNHPPLLRPLTLLPTSRNMISEWRQLQANLQQELRASGPPLLCRRFNFKNAVVQSCSRSTFMPLQLYVGLHVHDMYDI